MCVFRDADGNPDAMYFKDPQQLMDIFTQLESRNAFLMETVQEHKAALQELQQRLADTKAANESKQNQFAMKLARISAQA